MRDGIRDGCVLTDRVVEQDVRRNMLAFLAYDYEDDLFFNDVLAWVPQEEEKGEEEVPQEDGGEEDGGGMNFDPDGELDLSGFALESLKWLSANEPEFFRDVSKAILEDANRNFERTGKAYNSFDLLREIIEKTEQKRQQKVLDLTSCAVCGDAPEKRNYCLACGDDEGDEEIVMAAEEAAADEENVLRAQIDGGDE